MWGPANCHCVQVARFQKAGDEKAHTHTHTHIHKCPRHTLGLPWRCTCKLNYIGRVARGSVQKVRSNEMRSSTSRANKVCAFLSPAQTKQNTSFNLQSYIQMAGPHMGSEGSKSNALYHWVRWTFFRCFLNILTKTIFLLKPYLVL